ncbi:SPOR domain-containing protein [Vogesella sp. LYT5W]|uniref:SPOR domain-containing protein n=1 Tax=Vogesella margarita TaxID=2984199 RepID=A0ABT5INT8_9NEIS|nr:SPOR domain-containing protein [Vogesella margarita]MDC7714217.1 SPOR domain-containing protein [Vogesella margarita]
MNPTPQQRPPDGDGGLSPQIKKRIAIASGLVLIALAAIPIIDSFNTPATPPTPASTPISSGRIIQKDSSDSASLSLSAIDSSAPLEASAPSASAPAGHSPLAPAPGSPAGVTTLTPPQIQTPQLETQQARPPAIAANTAPPAGNGKSVTSVAPRSEPPRRDSAVPAPAITATPAPAPAIRVPLAEKPATAPRLTAPGIAPQGSSFGYQVQLGLFSSPDNAERLVSDLKKHGITARTETRVQLGPFRTRAEAEESMQRLRTLGYQPLLIPAGQR